jgi:hypothetical protein
MANFTQEELGEKLKPIFILFLRQTILTFSKTLARLIHLSANFFIT